jgi:hypothetical protein
MVARRRTSEAAVGHILNAAASARGSAFCSNESAGPFPEMDFSFDRLAGSGGSHFLVQSLPVGWAAEQLQRVLSRLNSDAFPRVVEWQEQRHQIDVALTWTEGISLAEYLQDIRDGRRPPAEPAQALRLVNGHMPSVICNVVCRSIMAISSPPM